MADELRGTPDRDGFGAQARRLLSEAVRLRGGVEGLRALALTDGPQHPDHFQVWVGALIQDGRLEAAAEAARQAIALLPLHGTAQGRICDALAWLATELKDSAGALDGRRQAWRAAPTRERLLALVATARACGRKRRSWPPRPQWWSRSCGPPAHPTASPGARARPASCCSWQGWWGLRLRPCGAKARWARAAPPTRGPSWCAT